MPRNSSRATTSCALSSRRARRRCSRWTRRSTGPSSQRPTVLRSTSKYPAMLRVPCPVPAGAGWRSRCLARASRPPRSRVHQSSTSRPPAQMCRSGLILVAGPVPFCWRRTGDSYAFAARYNFDERCTQQCQ
jgi:hypothetical protein